MVKGREKILLQKEVASYDLSLNERPLSEHLFEGYSSIVR